MDVDRRRGARVTLPSHSIPINSSNIAYGRRLKITGLSNLALSLCPHRLETSIDYNKLESPPHPHPQSQQARVQATSPWTSIPFTSLSDLTHQLHPLGSNYFASDVNIVYRLEHPRPPYSIPVGLSFFTSDIDQILALSLRPHELEFPILRH
ncbi:hypothetical protein CRG98_010126 [Punica granatum]|uniref:Uncharacterized protein n=1 Tax=Punica granatum TaxID=22663 RepID=A0A2I0KMJ3_PUNGR|nr:hypothetical protein CRG98_010126 [Punica granatum]